MKIVDLSFECVLFELVFELAFTVLLCLCMALVVDVKYLKMLATRNSPIFPISWQVPNVLFSSVLNHNKNIVEFLKYYLVLNS